jgi:hypothetical protein
VKTITLTQDMTLDGRAVKAGETVTTSAAMAEALLRQKLATETVSKK